MTTNQIIRGDIREIIASIEAEIPLFEGKTVVISGGAGFLGSYIVALFVRLNEERLTKPCKVIVLDNYITGLHRNIIADVEKSPHVTFIEHNIVQELPNNLNADYIIHMAGLASPYYYRKFPLETVDVAVTGTRNLLEYAKNKNVQSMLFFSSSEVYGDPHPNFIPTPETYWGNVSTTGPRACYDESKRLGETLCAIYYGLHGLPVKVVRPFNVYGPGMKIDDHRVIPTFMVRGIRGESIPVHEQGNQTRTFCYISDAITGFLKVLVAGKNGEVYNVGADSGEINIRGLAEMISQLFSPSIHVECIDYPTSYPAGEPQRRCPDLTKIKKELGFHPKIDLKTGLVRTLVWYQDQLKENELNKKKRA